MTYGPLEDQVSEWRKSASRNDPDLEDKLERAFEYMKADFRDLGCLSQAQVAEIQSVFSVPWISYDMQKGLDVPSSHRPNEMYSWLTNRYRVGNYNRTGVTRSGASFQAPNNNTTNRNHSTSPSTSSPKLQDMLQIILQGLDGISLDTYVDLGDEKQTLSSNSQHDHQAK